jgi:Domain of unknown function (DUF1877)
MILDHGACWSNHWQPRTTMSTIQAAYARIGARPGPLGNQFYATLALPISVAEVQRLYEATMGISLMYRRIPPAKLHELRVSQIEEFIDAYIYEDDPILSEEADQEEEGQRFNLDKLYSLVEGFLNPDNQKTSIFFHAFHHGKTVIGNPAFEHDDYLDVVYFLAPDQVQAIAQAMQDISPNEWLERYRLLMEEDSLDQARARSEFPTYDDMIDLFTDFREFFQQAADVGDGILRYYG